jgi:hypothetical protein
VLIIDVMNWTRHGGELVSGDGCYQLRWKYGDRLAILLSRNGYWILPGLNIEDSGWDIDYDYAIPWMA